MLAGKRRSHLGFTLIELLVTLTVAVILATVAVPNFQSLLNSSRMASDYNEVLLGINFARSEAIKRRTPVRFEASSNGTWQYDVSVVGGELLRTRRGRDGRTSMNAGTVTFNALGRPENCVAGDDCVFSVQSKLSGAADRRIQVTTMGRAGKFYDTDSEEVEE